MIEAVSILHSAAERGLLNAMTNLMLDVNSLSPIEALNKIYG